MSDITKERWLSLSLKVLDREGRNGLKISRLCEELGVTKGSFYHWFTSKADLDQAVLHYWQDIFTKELIRSAEVGSTAKEKLSRLVSRCIECSDAESRLEIEINIWAHQDATVGAFVKEVYVQRFSYLILLLEDIYPTKPEAKRHALILYSLIIGVELFYQKLTRDELEAVFSDYLL